MFWQMQVFLDQFVAERRRMLVKWGIKERLGRSEKGWEEKQLKVVEVKQLENDYVSSH